MRSALIIGIDSLLTKRCMRELLGLVFVTLLATTIAGCRAGAPGVAATSEAHDHEDTTIQATGAGDLNPLTLPALSPAALDGRPLRVVATTSIIGDVVGRVGGDAIELTTLMQPGQDPHSYQPVASDLTHVARADLVFVNGWDLEEGLLRALTDVSESAVFVPISAGIAPLPFGEHEADSGEEATVEGHSDTEGHEHEGADPHVWQSVPNVMQWVENAVSTLSAMDPANAATYRANADAYLAALEQLDAAVREQVATIPPERRVLVTNHDTLGHFAHEYGFDVIGTVIPGASTLSEPTAGDLAALIRVMRTENVCALFTETTVSDRAGAAIGGELTQCDEVRVVKLFTDALGPPGSGADSYIGMMRTNVEAIVAALR